MIYDSACTFEAASRKARARKQGSSEGVETQARLEHLEARLSEALARIDELEGLVPQGTVASDDTFLAVSRQDDDVDLVDRKPRETPLELPPLQEVLPAVQEYLATLNAVLPLFDPYRLLRSIHNWYAHPGQRDCTTWAAINVVLALFHRQNPPDQALSNNDVTHYLNNAQSVLTEVTMGDADLVNVQVLVGMVMLFQGAQDLKPATMLIAIALRLAHELGLQHVRSSEHLEISMILERNRVFWIAYILERDLSMRTRQPPLQLDIDIDIELPTAEPDDGAGLVLATDGSARFNFLRARVQLARIQGKIYEDMRSIRAQNLDTYQRSENMARLCRMLDDWSSYVPSQFRPDAILQAGGPNLCRSFGVLYATHLSCRTMICQAHVMETRWLQNVLDFGRKTARDGITAPAPLPRGWQALVNESREYMKLFMGIERKDAAFIWYESGLRPTSIR